MAAMTHVLGSMCSRAWHLHIFAALVLMGCGSDDGATNPGASGTAGGQVTDEWRDYCTATFTSDVAIQDGFGDTAFTAHAGEQYLLTEFDTFGGQPRAQIAYLTSLGPDVYSVPVTAGTTLPFTSNCTIDHAVQYYVAFTDVTLYATQDLTTKICDIPKDTSMLRDMTTPAGYSTVGLVLNGPQTYDIQLNVFSSMCGNATDGFVSVPQTQVLGVTTWLVPIDVLLKPQ